MLTPDHQTARRYLANLPSAERHALRHLLTCPECRLLTEQLEILDPLRLSLLAQATGAPQETTSADDRIPASHGDAAVPARRHLEAGGQGAGQSRGDNDAPLAPGTPLPTAATAATADASFIATPTPPPTVLPLQGALSVLPLPVTSPQARLAAGVMLHLGDLADNAACATTPAATATAGSADTLPAARQLLADLMMAPPALRRGLIRDQAVYHRPWLVRLLMARAATLFRQSLALDPSHRRFAAAPHIRGGPDALRAEAAELAVAVAEELPPPAGGGLHPLALDALTLAGRTWTHLGAERRATRTFARLAGATRPRRTPRAARAALCAGLAQLRWRQARFDEAAALFNRAADLWTAAGDTQPAALARAQLGFVHLEAGAAGAEVAAHRPLQIAHVQLEARVPALSARIALALAFCRAALGDVARAAELRIAAALAGLGTAAGAGAPAAHRTAPGPIAEPAHPGEWLACEWWEARIDAASGQLGPAAAQLAALRDELLVQGTLAEAARASLDLAEVRVALGQDAGLGALGRELRAAFATRHPSLAGRVADLFAHAFDGADAGAGAGAEADTIGSLRAALWSLERLPRGGEPRQPPPYILDIATLAELFLITDPVP